MLVELQVFKPFFYLNYRHLNKIGDASSAYLHIVGFWFQTCSMTLWAVCLASVSSQHYSVLYLVLVLAYHIKEGVDTWFLFFPLVRGKSVPQPVFMLLTKIHVWLEDREVVFRSITTEPLFPLLHSFAMPAYHTSIIDRKGGVWNNQLLINADNTSETLALGACSCW